MLPDFLKALIRQHQTPFQEERGNGDVTAPGYPFCSEDYFLFTRGEANLYLGMSVELQLRLEQLALRKTLAIGRCVCGNG